MSEAKKLLEETGEPTVFATPIIDDAPAEESVFGLEPRTATLAVRPPRTVNGRRIFNVVLVLFIIGLVAFAIGVALAGAVLTGSLDLTTGWVKETLVTAKDIVQHFVH